MRPLAVVSADLDSQLHAALPAADAFRARGWRTLLAVPPQAPIPAWLAERARARHEILPVPLALLPFSEAAGEAAAVVAFAAASALARLRRDARLAARVRGAGPALVAGFNGAAYERFEEGLAWRLGYDVICLAGPRDEALARAFLCDTPQARQRFVLTGLRASVPDPPRRPSVEPGRMRVLVFAEQVAAPRRPAERRWLFDALAGVARDNPGWRVIVKPRLSPGERTFHPEILSPAAHFAKTRTQPSNLALDHRPLDVLLAEADLLGTVSSTAAFDAHAAGVPFFVVEDLGVRNGDGGHFFFGARVGARLGRRPDLHALAARRPDPAWLAAVGADGAAGWGALVDALELNAPFDPPANPYDAAPLESPGRRPAETARERTARQRALGLLDAGDRVGAAAALKELAAALREADAAGAPRWRRLRDRLARAGAAFSGGLGRSRR